ncbi:EAL domain-containing protein [Lysobacter sp. A6]|uniref:EAL domain-containing protein n=1 Tax=Noviluteimonas lactosilytica TaxID=2888523 RepID=A0ABS8JE72_9GAMM|nr:EAL domain-containing protein [Lysobacter lactosilyticus]MCC8361908.1 EAL domain-containing protein [Lysobacter lactosilyticus]
MAAQRAIGLRTWTIVLVAGLLVAMAATVALRRTQAAPPQDSQAQPAHTVRFGADMDYAPFSRLDAKGEPNGYDVELFKSVAAHAGLDPDIRLGTWQRVRNDLDAGELDVVPMLVTDARKRHLLFSEPYLRFYHLAFGPKGGKYVGTLGELAGARVAVQRAGMAWEYLHNTPGVRIVEVDNEPDALRAVAAGQADYAIVPTYIGYEAQRRLRLRDIVALSPAFYETSYAFAVAQDRPDLVPKLNAGLREAMRSGDQQRIYINYLANLTPTQETFRSGLFRAAWAVVPLTAMAIVLLVWWRRARRRSINLEYFDPVTQVLNRRGFRRRLGELILQRKPFAVVRLDLQEIGAVDAMAGPAFVDDLLRGLADRLKAESTHVAKVDDRGFQVAVQCPTSGAGAPNNAELAQNLMHHLLDTIKARIEVAGVPMELVASAGAAMYPAHGDTPDLLMRAANLATEEAMQRPGAAVLYHQSLAPDASRLTLLTDLRAAIRDRTLGHALQPKLDLRTGKICGAEMLVRWKHPQHGDLPPGDFVPLAERTGVIGEMTTYLVEQAIAHCRDWQAQELDLTLSVNVSVNDLSDAAVVDHIVQAARDVRGQLMLEVTETAVMRDPETAFAAVERLRAGGLRISLDDFGTGNASLTYLRRLAPEEVKIDRSFITGLLGSEADQRIVRSTIQLAHAVNAVVTAEGVEDKATLAWLREAGCENAQGYGVGRAVDAVALIEGVRGNAEKRTG